MTPYAFAVIEHDVDGTIHQVQLCITQAAAFNFGYELLRGYFDEDDEGLLRAQHVLRDRGKWVGYTAAVTVAATNEHAL